ncbi:serine/threonine-protein kinase Sgk2 [Trichoderma sp. SZMC 28014]
MTLTQKQEEIIAEIPLGGTLAPVRDRLCDANNTDADDIGKEIATILSALVTSTAAYNLIAPDGRNVAERLLPILQRVRRGTIQPGHFSALIRCVIDKATDVDIWEAVFAILDDLSAITPPSSNIAPPSSNIAPPSSNIAPTFKGTPVKSSSSRLGNSETRNIVERELFFEIKDCTFRNVGGFFDRFFDPERWSASHKSMVKGLMAAHNGSKWTDFPTTPDEKPVWEWFKALEKRYLCDAPHKLHTTKTANQFKERKGQMDLFFQAPVEHTTFEYKDVLVIGEQKKSYDTGRFKADFLQLTRLVRSVFSDQPTRRFVHAFSLCASTMELWVFDRSGPYSSGPFNIHNEPDKFARAFVGYATMDNGAMGLDTFIERSGGHLYLNLDDVKNGEEKRIRLDKAMVRQRAIVCRGTTCYETEHGHVAKFSWTSSKRKLEMEQLKQAEQRGVKGVAKAISHHQITSIASIRKGLEFSKPHRFRDEIHFEDLPSTIAGTTSSSTKRKASSDDASENASESKRRRSNSQRSTLSTELNKQSLVSKTKPSLYTTSEDLWEDRIYSCLVVSPAGRVISDFKTIKELLESMRDAIKAHQSLYTTGNILHRDISPNNIIITDPEKADGFKGMLIDLDLAKELNSGPSGARHQTGTMQFMAVEVLRTIDHTYRHDLESFFYVLIWMCARQSWQKLFVLGRPPMDSLLRRWEIGTFKSIADAKIGHMTVDGLENIMSEFPESFGALKPLCLKIRKVLFPLNKDERMSFGTPAGDPAELYKPIIAAYDESISAL